MKKIYKKILLSIVGIILLIIIASKFASLDEKIFLINIKYYNQAKLDKVKIDEQDNVVKVYYTSSYIGGLSNKTIKRIVDNSRGVIYDDKSYSDCKMEFSLNHTSGSPLFSIVYDGKKCIEKVYCAINVNEEVIPLSTICRDYPSVENLRLERFDYEDYCNLDNYTGFNNLKSISLSQKPSDEVINYIKEKFPNCLLEYDNE
ncbi:hypothetical protein [Eubacterium sp.]|uniref:hypothetical protein n=1 Tax=Eubacterium sp. TaxID=142586 RepID=UPI0025E5B06C|nr:hypothetical protein [Eubacterium sp.]MCR5629454.1 hypothetical protein [Eubacterium sp.]